MTIGPNAVRCPNFELDSEFATSELDRVGCVTIKGLLDQETCDTLRGWYSNKSLFRNTVVMAKHGFGRGEYKYFCYPLPDCIAQMRRFFYEALAPIANHWAAALREDVRFPALHGDFLKRCHDEGQRRPTPLLLKYGVGDYNCLHQDLYGRHVFPLQAVILLSCPSSEFTGGEFVLVEQRPRMQSRPYVAPLRKGDALIFPAHRRPKLGGRGYFRVAMRHGVSELRSGERFALGLISHDSA